MKTPTCPSFITGKRSAGGVRAWMLDAYRATGERFSTSSRNTGDLLNKMSVSTPSNDRKGPPFRWTNTIWSAISSTQPGTLFPYFPNGSKRLNGAVLLEDVPLVDHYRTSPQATDMIFSLSSDGVVLPWVLARTMVARMSSGSNGRSTLETRGCSGAGGCQAIWLIFSPVSS